MEKAYVVGSQVSEVTLPGKREFYHARNIGTIGRVELRPLYLELSEKFGSNFSVVLDSPEPDDKDAIVAVFGNHEYSKLLKDRAIGLVLNVGKRVKVALNKYHLDDTLPRFLEAVGYPSVRVKYELWKSGNYEEPPASGLVLAQDWSNRLEILEKIREMSKEEIVSAFSVSLKGYAQLFEYFNALDKISILVLRDLSDSVILSKSEMVEVKNIVYIKSLVESIRRRRARKYEFTYEVDPAIV